MPILGIQNAIADSGNNAALFYYKFEFYIKLIIAIIFIFQIFKGIRNLIIDLNYSNDNSKSLKDKDSISQENNLIEDKD